VEIRKQKCNRITITLLIQIIFLGNLKQIYLKVNNLNLMELIVKCSSIKLQHRNKLIKYSIKNSHHSKLVVSWLIIQIQIVSSILGKIRPSREVMQLVNKILQLVKVFLDLHTPKCIKCNKTSKRWSKTTKPMFKLETGSNNNLPKVKTSHSTYIVQPIIQLDKTIPWMMMGLLI